MEEISKDPKIRFWYSTYGLSPKTQQIYNHAVSKYCDLTGKTPTQLIDEAISEVKSGKLPYECKFAEYIVQFKDKLIADDLAPKTQSVELTAIKSFYSVFNISVPSRSCVIKHAKPLEDNINNILKTADVKNLITHAATLRDRAIILLMATSGLARNEIINLKIKNITFEKLGDKPDSPEIGIIKVRRIKTQVDYVTFCSPEACAAIKAYLEERNMIPQNVSNHHFMPLEKLKVKGKDDYLFIDYTYAIQMKGSAIISMFRRLSDRLGYYGGKGVLRKSRSHALRKYFATTLENAGMQKSKVDYLLGHHRSSSDIAYFHADIEVLKKLYIDYLKYLTFEHEIEIHNINTDDEKRLVALEAENRELKESVNAILDILDVIDPKKLKISIKRVQ